MADRVQLLVATRKGAFILDGTAEGGFAIDGPHFLGNIVHHLVLDPRDGRTMLLSASTGHLGPTLYRSEDRGRSWQEVASPPRFPAAKPGARARAVDHVFWLTPGHADEPRTWYAGTSPQGLFRSEDGGERWESVAGFNDHAMYEAWTGADKDGTPDGPKLHSILVDPRDPKHLYIGMSSGGFFESRDRGASWAPLNRGCVAEYLPSPEAEYGHDPHRVALHPRRPDRLYQQNHCGIYRMDRPEDRWIRIGAAMPPEIGDIGFPIVLHPARPDTVWVFPMDGTTVWPRVSPGGRPAVWRSDDAGASWRRQDRGLPRAQAWFTVKRQAFCSDGADAPFLVFGTTQGSLWASADEGESWRVIAEHLPEIYAVEAVPA